MRKKTASSPRLRPLDAPRSIQVRTGANDTPVQVRLARTPLQVLSIRERWRIDDEWWRAPIHRIYHQVVLEDGRVVTLYRDLTDGRWYLHGRGSPASKGPGATSSRPSNPAVSCPYPPPHPQRPRALR